MESSLHVFFKGVIRDELTRKGYHLYVEPSESPLKRVQWDNYRPDVFGVISNERELRLIFVECELNPTIQHVQAKSCKIKRWLTIQKRLNETHLVRLLLVIPPMRLHRINNPEIRRFWEMWIVDYRGRITQKIPSTNLKGSNN